MKKRFQRLVMFYVQAGLQLVQNVLSLKKYFQIILGVGQFVVLLMVQRPWKSLSKLQGLGQVMKSLQRLFHGFLHQMLF